MSEEPKLKFDQKRITGLVQQNSEKLGLFKSRVENARTNIQIERDHTKLKLFPLLNEIYPFNGRPEASDLAGAKSFLEALLNEIERVQNNHSDAKFAEPIRDFSNGVAFQLKSQQDGSKYNIADINLLKTEINNFVSEKILQKKELPENKDEISTVSEDEERILRILVPDREFTRNGKLIFGIGFTPSLWNRIWAYQFAEQNGLIATEATSAKSEIKDPELVNQAADFISGILRQNVNHSIESVLGLPKVEKAALIPFVKEQLNKPSFKIEDIQNILDNRLKSGFFSTENEGTYKQFIYEYIGQKLVETLKTKPQLYSDYTQKYLSDISMFLADPEIEAKYKLPDVISYSQKGLNISKVVEANPQEIKEYGKLFFNISQLMNEAAFLGQVRYDKKNKS